MLQGRSLIALLLLVGLMGCNGPNSKYRDLGERANTESFGHRYAQPDDEDDLTLGPGDVINIQVANLPEFQTQQPVRFDGRVTGPLGIDVKVAGLTPRQVSDKLTVLLNPYIRDVNVQVVAVKITSKRLYLYTTGRFGELVGRMMPLEGDMTLLDLITMIGGVPQLADDAHVRVVRGDPRHPKQWDINVAEMILKGYTGGNIQMKPDDIVFLPPSFFARVAQAINVATLPVRVISRGIQDMASTYYFIDSGVLPRGRGNNRGVGY